MIYLDYAANSKVDKEVLDTFYNITDKYFANPNSNHKLGRVVKDLIDKTTKDIADKLNVLSEEIIYTSGATECNNLVIKGICERYKNNGKHIILSSLEHSSLIAPATIMQDKGFDVDLIPVTKDGVIDINELKKIIRDDTILVSVCSIDSELGIKQPIEEIGKLLKNYPNIFFHTDASQAIGKINIDFTDVDLITVSPHKFYGLNGFGALIKKKDVMLKPILNGGKSTTVYRSGTPVVGNIVALSKALEIALDKQEERNEYVLKLNQILVSKLKNYKAVHINNPKCAIPYIINFSIKGVKSLDFVKMLEENEIYVSAKTSCCPVGTPSKSVYAVTHNKNLASSSIRVSLCHLTTIDEINTFLSIFDKCYKELEINGKI